MNDIIFWLWIFIITIGLCSMVIIPILGFCYHVTKIKMKELKEMIDL